MKKQLKEAAIHFYERIFADPMIGFMFAGLDPNHLAEREYELMARVCNLEVKYRGRPIGAAHAKHRIRRGQFNRRLVLLEESLQSAGVANVLIQRIVAHNLKLAPLILGGAKDDNCDHADDDATEPGLKVYR